VLLCARYKSVAPNGAQQTCLCVSKIAADSYVCSVNSYE